VALLADPSLDSLVDADLAARHAAHDEIDRVITRWTVERDPFVTARLLQEAGLAAAPAFTNGDLVDDPHLASRGFVVEWDQPDVGPRRFPGFPIHFERTPVHIAPAPTLGQHNRPILSGLGFSDDEIATLEARHVVSDEPPLA
jgi:crotonobetainyl-CoA:carnitine CoA-transferase CaiB-like acyl-CoA transferase